MNTRKETEKKCCGCKLIKPLSEFPRNRSTPSGYRSRCKVCTNLFMRRRYQNLGTNPRTEHLRNLERKSKFKIKYGLTQIEVLELRTQQGDRCKICNKEATEKKPLSIDHDHRTGNVRGLLCQSCNLLLAMAGDNIGVLKEAITYLRESNTEQ